MKVELACPTLACREIVQNENEGGKVNMKAFIGLHDQLIGFTCIFLRDFRWEVPAGQESLFLDRARNGGLSKY